MTLFWYGIIAYLLGAFSSLFFTARRKSLAVLVGAVPGAVLTTIAAFGALLHGAPSKVWLDLGDPIGVATFGLDPLSSLFIIVVAVMGLVSLIYAGGYLRSAEREGRNVGSHWVFLLVLIVSMMLVLVARQAVVFLVFWEMMSVSSFFLVFFENEKREVLKAALNYFVTMHAGLFFLIVGFALLSARGGFGFAALADAAQSVPSLKAIAFLLLFVGFGIKAGFVPLHSWLPQAHPAAPSHVSALMSGVMIKMGIYGILRLIVLFAPLPVGIAYFVLVIAALSAVLGVIYAIAQHDLKRLLAYHSVENIGIIGLGIGVGLLGTVLANPVMSLLGYGGALLHVLNHSVFKGLLFYGAGAVYQTTHVRDLNRLGGLAKSMRATAAFFLVGSIAISGLPPLNGFVSELLIYLGLFRGTVAGSPVTQAVTVFTIALLAGVGALALFCFTKVFGVAFLGQPRTAAAVEAREARASMLLPMAFLALLCVLIGVGPGLAVRAILPAAAFVTDAGNAGNGSILSSTLGLNALSAVTSTFDSLSIVFTAFIGAALVLFVGRALVLRRHKRAAAQTWGCGYDAPTPRMQYTASSYARPLLEVVSPLFERRDRSIEVKGLFPVSAVASTHREEVLDAYVIRPITGALRFLVDRFTWIQSGNLQQYILYGLVFLVITILWILGAAR